MAAQQPRLSDQFKSEVTASHELKPVETVEKQVLPTKEDIAKEKTPQLVQAFNVETLKHVDPQVKNHVPDAEEYARERVKSEASTFDHDKLHHVETNVKTSVEVIDEK